MNTPSDHNPYQPPKADITPQDHHMNDEWVSGGQSVSPGNAIAWIGSGWTLFMKSPGIWIANILIVFVLSAFLAFIPVLGGLASNLLMPVVIGGILLGCRSLDEGGTLEVAHLFAAFKEKAGQLVLVGLLMLVATVAIIIVTVVAVIVVFGSSILQAIGDEQAAIQLLSEQGLMMLAFLVLLFMALIIPVAMAYWFAPALVVFHNLDAVSAMRNSFMGCLRNFLPFLLYGLVFLVLAIIAVIPIGLGFLVLIPMGYGSLYASYKDIYLPQHAE
jgi:uncharacterized membrane protein